MKVFNLFPLTIVQEKISIEENEREILVNEIKKMQDNNDSVTLSDCQIDELSGPL